MATTKEVTESSAAGSQGAAKPDALNNGVKLIGEYVMPGASLILDGKIGPGALHLAAGLLGRAILGPPGWILVAANSYSRSCTNKGLLEHAREQVGGG